MIVACDGEHNLHVWDFVTGRRLREISGNRLSNTWLEISPDQTVAATIGEGRGICVIGLPTGRRVAHLDTGGGEVLNIVWTPDGQRVLSACADGEIDVWDIRSGTCESTISGHEGAVTDIRVSCDGKLAISVGEDQILRVWDLRDGSLLASYFTYSPRYKWMFRREAHLTNPRADGRVVLGTSDGHLHFLRLSGSPMATPLATAERPWRVAAGAIFEERGSTLDAPCFEVGEAIPGNYDERVTAVCPWCAVRFEPRISVLECVYATGALDGGLAPSLQLPIDAWDDPRLTDECCHCRRPVQFNPFVVDGSAYWDR